MALARPVRLPWWRIAVALLGAALVGAVLAGAWGTAALILAGGAALTIAARQPPPVPRPFIGPMKRRASDFLRIGDNVTIFHPTDLPDRLREDLEAIRPLLDILRGQIEGVQHDAAEGVMSVVEQVQAIDRLTARQRERIADSLSGAGAMQGAAEVPRAIVARLSAMLADRDRAIAANYAGLETLAAEFQDLRGALDVISKVADKAFFLAINASVEAHRQGTAGLAFGLIATEMRVLATQTAEGAREVGQGINTFAERMQRQILAALPDRGAGAGAGDEVQALVRELESAQEEVAAVSARLATLMQVMEQGHQDILHSLADILGRLQFQDVMHQRLGQVGDALGDLREVAAASVAGTPPPRSVRQLIEDQQARYVMASQTEVHARLAGSGAAPTEGSAALKIELF